MPNYIYELLLLPFSQKYLFQLISPNCNWKWKIKLLSRIHLQKTWSKVQFIMTYLKQSNLSNTHSIKSSLRSGSVSIRVQLSTSKLILKRLCLLQEKCEFDTCVIWINTILILHTVILFFHIYSVHSVFIDQFANIQCVLSYICIKLLNQSIISECMRHVNVLLSEIKKKKNSTCTTSLWYWFGDGADHMLTFIWPNLNNRKRLLTLKFDSLIAKNHQSCM